MKDKLLSKKFLVAIIVALCMLLGYEISADDASRLACLIATSGC